MDVTYTRLRLCHGVVLQSRGACGWLMRAYRQDGVFQGRLQVFATNDIALFRALWRAQGTLPALAELFSGTRRRRGTAAGAAGDVGWRFRRRWRGCDCVEEGIRFCV